MEEGLHNRGAYWNRAYVTGALHGRVHLRNDTYREAAYY